MDLGMLVSQLLWTTAMTESEQKEEVEGGEVGERDTNVLSDEAEFDVDNKAVIICDSD